jgi:hypothetical protein
MTDLPNPRTPLTKGEQAVFGDSIRHPITGYPITRSVDSTDANTLSPNDQARLNHLPMIEREHGKAVHDRIKGKLDAWEAAGNSVDLPAEILPVGFEHARRKP